MKSVWTGPAHFDERLPQGAMGLRKNRPMAVYIDESVERHTESLAWLDELETVESLNPGVIQQLPYPASSRNDVLGVVQPFLLVPVFAGRSLQRAFRRQSSVES